MIALAALLGGGAIFSVLLYLIRAARLHPAEARLGYVASVRQIAVTSGADGGAVLRRRVRFASLSLLLDRNRYAARWASELEHAGTRLRPSEYFLIRVALAAVTVAAISVIGQSPVALLIGVACGAVAYMLPAFWLNVRARRRLALIESQLPEMITLICNALRAGFAFAQGVDIAAKQVGGPISAELNRALLDINLGASAEDALRAMNERVGSDDLDIVVTAILVQRNVGGNLAEVLEKVCETMRDRERIRGEIKTLTTTQSFTGWVLCLWPATLALLFFAINPSMTSLLWTTSNGLVLLAIWGVLNVIGIIAIRRILDIDI